MASYINSITKAVSRIAKQAAAQDLTYRQALALVQAEGYKDAVKLFVCFNDPYSWQEYVKTQRGL